MLKLPDPLEWIQDYWAMSDNKHCDECPNQRTTRGPRLEHFGTPCHEILNECDVVDKGADPQSCPAWQEHKGLT